MIHARHGERNGSDSLRLLTAAVVAISPLSSLLIMFGMVSVVDSGDVESIGASFAQLCVFALILNVGFAELQHRRRPNATRGLTPLAWMFAAPPSITAAVLVWLATANAF